MKLWKVLGVAGVAGVAATGAVVARAERRRRAYEPDDVRARLLQRHAAAQATDAEPPIPAPPTGGNAPGCLKAPWGRLGRRRRPRRT
ncbi:MAG: hypothetical protein ABIS47_09630 [Acidimicrobiales bacterium]